MYTLSNVVSVNTVTHSSLRGKEASEASSLTLEEKSCYGAFQDANSEMR
jgi:hypothetical protein